MANGKVALKVIIDLSEDATMQVAIGLLRVDPSEIISEDVLLLGMMRISLPLDINASTTDASNGDRLYILNGMRFLSMKIISRIETGRREAGLFAALDEITAVTKPRRRLWGSSKNSKRKNRQRFNRFKQILHDNVILNFSDHQLTRLEICVLNKGLGFVPSSFQPNFYDICKDVTRFERKLQLHLFFSKNEANSDGSSKPFEGNPDWWPKSLNGHITKFCSKLKYLVRSSCNTRYRMNVTHAEMAALRSLKENRLIVIKKCDKGGGVAIMNSADYLAKIKGMLQDATTYTLTDIDDSVEVKRKADEIFRQLGANGCLGSKQVSYLTRFTPRCPLFYGLPKVHKKDIPLRPIVSQIDGPTCKLNEYVDKLLFVAEKCIPFLLQDTTAFLRLINANKTCLPETLLVSLDVTSLYTNIPHEEGATWVSDFYEETLHAWQNFDVGIEPIDKDELKNLILFILHNCTFEFDGRMYRQNFGTTMGAAFSVKFANIYMHMWLRKFTSSYNGSVPPFIARLIDDCFFIWNHAENELLDFFTYLNSCHPTIKFEYQYSKEKINFLDTVTYIVDDVIRTTLYIKPTDRKQFLFFTSCHPSHIKRAIPFSQALRYRRIIDDDSMLKLELENLRSKFLKRGYPPRLLQESFDKASKIDRSSTLRYKTTGEKRACFDKFLNGKSFLPLIVTFHYGLHDSAFRRSFLDLWHTFCAVDPYISSVFGNELPQIVFKRGKTIGNVVTGTRFRPYLDNIDSENVRILASLLNENATTYPFGVAKCNRPRCLCCDHITVGSTFTDSSGKYVRYIEQNFDCCSSNIIYLIHCRKCNVRYVGQTARQLKERLNNHRSDVRLQKNTAIGIHFNEPSHIIEDLRIMPIADISTIPERERYLIENDFMRLLKTSYPNGLNAYPMIDTD